jgi:signal peptidase I
MSAWMTAAACVGLALAVFLALAALRLGFAVATVSGSSMLPTFRPGERVLVRRTRREGIEVGAVVVLRAPAMAADRGSGWVIKRVAALPGDLVPGAMRVATAGAPVVPRGLFLVSADNERGTDSRHWGFVSVEQILGPVVRRLAPGRGAKATAFRAVGDGARHRIVFGTGHDFSCRRPS